MEAVIVDAATFVAGLPLLARSSVPPLWYAVLAIVVATPIFFLVTRPRKRTQNVRWKR